MTIRIVTFILSKIDVKVNMKSATKYEKDTNILNNPRLISPLKMGRKKELKDLFVYS